MKQHFSTLSRLPASLCCCYCETKTSTTTSMRRREMILWGSLEFVREKCASAAPTTLSMAKTLEIASREFFYTIFFNNEKKVSKVAPCHSPATCNVAFRLLTAPKSFFASHQYTPTSLLTTLLRGERKKNKNLKHGKILKKVKKRRLLKFEGKK